MLYTNSNTTTITLPRVSSHSVDTLRIVNQTSHIVTTLAVTDTTPTKDYYTFDLTGLLTSLDDGQYDLYVEKDNVTYASAVMQYGEYTLSKTTHTPTINIKEYNG